MTLSDAPHLSPAAREILSLSNAERITQLKKPRWIGYTAAHAILNTLEDLLHYPKQPRMPNMLLVGETNNGKTLLIDHFRKKYPADERIGSETIRVPVLAVQAPPGPDERSLYSAMLEKLFERLKPAESTEQKRFRLISVLRQIELGIIVIDEIHHTLAGSALKQRNFLNTLKYLGNELQVPIVGVGTTDALRAMQIDPQIQNRFVPEVLPRWELNAEFAKLLASFERIIPLRNPSGLPERKLASRLLALSGGTIGELTLLLEKAATYAIQSGTEVIDATAIERCSYIPPSERRAKAARL